MTLIDELRAASSRKGPACGVEIALSMMEPDLADEVRAALKDPLVAKSVLSRWLRQHGHNVAESTVQRHCGGRCACPSSTS